MYQNFCECILEVSIFEGKEIIPFELDGYLSSTYAWLRWFSDSKLIVFWDSYICWFIWLSMYVFSLEEKEENGCSYFRFYYFFLFYIKWFLLNGKIPWFIYNLEIFSTFYYCNSLLLSIIECSSKHFSNDNWLEREN